MATLDQVYTEVLKVSNAVLGDGTKENPGLASRVSVIEERCEFRGHVTKSHEGAKAAMVSANINARGVVVAALIGAGGASVVAIIGAIVALLAGVGA